MKWIKEFFVALEVKKNRPIDYQKYKKSIEDIKSIHILAASNDDLLVIERVVRANWPNELSFSGRYYNEEEDSENNFTQNDFNLLGKPNESLQSFLNDQADIFVVAVDDLNSYMHLVTKNKHAAFKIGFHSPEGGELLDLMLAKEKDDLVSNIENLLKYLKKII
ncbi:hypothetical protein [Echinicola sp. 20G]|uniref:DUF6913 domain-containing protein n=1 Tax=Echinicola sp. 20G TaxID=2781961 RepID=UPI0019108980|nr:hypothetical protein [Echinicola sp. 20G]